MVLILKKIFFYLYFFFFLFFNESTRSETIRFPLPEITNYPPSVNGGFTQTWDITQGKDGILYFANTYGLLMYDGSKWRSLILDNEYSARSVDVDKKGNILLGSRGDFGFVSNDGTGNPKFTSLKKFLNQEYISKEIIHETIFLKNEEIFFRSDDKLFFFKDKKFTTIEKVSRKFGVSRNLNDNLYIHLSGLGLARIENKKIILIPNSEIFKEMTVTGFHLSKENNLIIFTRDSGVYKQENSKFVKIKSDIIDKIEVIYKTYNLKNNKIGLATYEGLYIFDSNLSPLLHLDSNSGLRTDNVRSIFEDRSGNIWLGLDDGISKVNVNSFFKYLPVKETNLNSKVNSIQIFNKHLYVGTSTDIKKLVVDEKRNLKQKFIQVAKLNINTQVWSLLNSNESLLIGSNIGFGLINNNDEYLQLIDYNITGRVIQIIESEIFNNQLLLRASKGIFLVDKINPKKFITLYEGGNTNYINELKNENEIWFAVEKKGIYKINLVSTNIEDIKKSVIKLYAGNTGFNTEIVQIFKIYDELIFNIENNIFHFNKKKEEFNASLTLKKIPNLENKKILDIKRSTNNTYWINFTERKGGKRIQEFYELNNLLEVRKLPFDLISHHLNIEFFFFKDLTLMGGNEGIVIIEASAQKLNEGKIIISNIKNNNISIHDLGPIKDFMNNDFKIKNLFKYNQNRISFSVSLTDFTNENMNKFRFKLEGLESEFSEFTKNENFTYTNLEPGNYTLKVQGINSDGVVSETSDYSFTIQYPWWQSRVFYFAEFLFFSFLLILTLFLKKSKKAVFITTSITFMMILVLFEIINFIVEPFILHLTDGIPVLSIISKVILGLLLSPLEIYINKMLNFFSKKLPYSINSKRRRQII